MHIGEMGCFGVPQGQDPAHSTYECGTRCPALSQERELRVFENGALKRMLQHRKRENLTVRISKFYLYRMLLG
jgi:hypothetical protein